jgi:hypothetical protein
MRTHLILISILILVALNSIILAQQVESTSAGEIIFDDSILNQGFNKVYLLQSGEHVTVKNLCSSEEIAIGLKNYLDISNKLAIVYQRRDSISLKIITEYGKIGKAIDNISLDLRMVSDSLKKVSELNLQPSINSLNDSNSKLESSNKQLGSAVERLDEINSDLNKIHLKNIWENAGYALAGVLIGVLIGGAFF